jgi:chorismate synthase
MFEGKTTGTPLTLIIRNTDQHSKDYTQLKVLPRPSHADYSGSVRYAGCNDYRGGGHFSGRLTAPLVAAGAIAKQLLAQRGVFVGAHIASVAGIQDKALDTTRDQRELLSAVAAKEFPTIDDQQGQLMQQAILDARAALDSVGGTIECMVSGLPAGVGAPDLDENVEGIFARHLFAVPAVKGLEFGAGFALAGLRGSQANDPFRMEDGQVRTRTNRAGGVNGGITNGMPVVFTVAMRPTPSISQEQDTVDLTTGQNAKLVIHGRHDPCIVHRAVPVIEAAAALAACQLLGV